MQLGSKGVKENGAVWRICSRFYIARLKSGKRRRQMPRKKHDEMWDKTELLNDRRMRPGLPQHRQEISPMLEEAA
jgi:hypothetical protein